MNQMLKIQKKSDENVLDDESDVEDSEEDTSDENVLDDESDVEDSEEVR